MCGNVLQLQQALQEQAAKLEASTAQRLDSLAAAHAAQLQQLQQLAEQQLQQQLQRHAAEVTALKQDHQQAMALQQQGHAAALQAAVEKARHDAEALRAAAAGSQTELEAHLR